MDIGASIWLSQQDGFRRRIKLEHADYFRLSLRDEAEARAAPHRPAPSIKQSQRALAMMPEATPRELRDKAIFALLCLTGIRVGALICVGPSALGIFTASALGLSRAPSQTSQGV